jgi:hypothetical protein
MFCFALAKISYVFSISDSDCVVILHLLLYMTAAVIPTAAITPIAAPA